MHSRVSETEKRWRHDSGNHIHHLRHPYDRYKCGVSNCNLYCGESNESPDSFSRDSPPPAKGLQERNDLPNQSFLTENPFFGAYYPGLRPRSLAPGAGSGRGSERSRSIGTDFDDSKTYRVIYSCDSRCSEEYGIQSKKDDIRHFHEHHHFFHDKSEEKSEGTRPSGKIWETFPCGKKCFLNYSARESRTACPTIRDAPRRGRGGSGSSSRSGKESSDNETHPVPCKRCQKFLKEYPDARIVRPSKKGRQEHADPQSPIDVTHVDVIVAESLSEMEKLSLSREKECSKKREKTCKVDSEGLNKDAMVKKLRSDGNERKIRNETEKSRKSEARNSACKSVIFKCNRCYSVIEKCPLEGARPEGTDAENEATRRRSSATKRPIIVDERKAHSAKKCKDRSGTGKSARMGASVLSEKAEIFVGRASIAAEHSSVEDNGGSSRRKEGVGKRSSSYDALADSVILERRSGGHGKAGAIGQSQRSVSVRKSSRERVGTRKKVSSVSGSDFRRECRVRKSGRDAEAQEITSCGVDDTAEKDPKRDRGRRQKTGKVGGKTIIIRTEERSMQTSDRNLAVHETSPPPRRGKTDAKRNVRVDPKRSGTAPGGLVSGTSVDYKAENRGIRGSAILTRRTVAQKKSPVSRAEVLQESNAIDGLAGIGSELTGLKSHLERLEAMHGLRGERTDSAVPESREAADYPKHPIVVCTSTTYIMTKCSKGCGDRMSPVDSPVGKRFGTESPPAGEGRRSRPGGGSSSDRFYKAGRNRVLSPEEVDRCVLGGTLGESCPWNDAVREGGLLLRSFSDNVYGSERLIAFRSYSTSAEEFRPGRSETVPQEEEFDRCTGLPLLSDSEVRIDETVRRGRILRTSASDICEYKNGSLIRLFGKSEWVVYTKRLFFSRTGRRNFGEEPAHLGYSAGYPTDMNACSRSVVTLKKAHGPSGEAQESYTFMTEGKSVPEDGMSDSGVCLLKGTRLVNKGATDLHCGRGRVIQEDPFPVERKSLREQVRGAMGIDGPEKSCTCRRGRMRKKREKSENPSEGLWGISFKSRRRIRALLGELSGEPADESDSRGSVANRKCFPSAPCRADLEENFSMKGEHRKTKWHQTTENNKIEGDSSDARNRPEGDSLRNRCACCRCRPNHECSPHVEQREELTGFRRFLRDLGFTGLSLGLAKKLPYRSRGSTVVPQREEISDDVKSDEHAGEFSTIQVAKKVNWDETTTDSSRKTLSVNADVLDNNSLQGRTKQYETLFQQVEVKDAKRGETSASRPKKTKKGKRSPLAGHSDIYAKEGVDTNGKNLSNFFLEEAPVEKLRSEEDVKDNIAHSFCSLPSKIEIISERTVCTCEKCSHMHYVDKHYLPTSYFKKCWNKEGPKAPEVSSFQNAEDSSEPKQPLEKAEEHQREMVDVRTSTVKRKTKDKSMKKKKKSLANRAEEAGRVSEEETFVKQSDLDVPPSNVGTSLGETANQQGEVCTCVSKLRSIEDRLKALERRKAIRSLRKRPSTGLRTTGSQERGFLGEGTVIPHKQEYLEEKTETPEERESLREETMSLQEREFLGERTASTQERGSLREGSMSSQERGSFTERTKTSQQQGFIREGSMSSQERGSVREETMSSQEKDSFREGSMSSQERESLGERTASTQERGSIRDKIAKPRTQRQRSVAEKSITSEELSSESGTIVEENSSWSELTFTTTSGSIGTSDEYSSPDVVSQVEPPEPAVPMELPSKDKMEEKQSFIIREYTSSSLEDIRSETDVEVKTKVITCENMSLFEASDPNAKTPCRCTEGSYCPFKFVDEAAVQKNIFFVTNLELPRQWSAFCDHRNYEYYKRFCGRNRLKSSKLPRDWDNVRTAVASLFRSCKLGRKSAFRRRRDTVCVGESCSGLGSDAASEISFLDDCSRSSSPLQKRSFHVWRGGPLPTYAKEKLRAASKTTALSDRRRKKKNRRKRTR